jgi:hypothetical protein
VIICMTAPVARAALRTAVPQSAACLVEAGAKRRRSKVNRPE